MKKAQLKSIFLFALIMIMSVASIFALTVTLNNPSDEWITTSSVDFNFTPAGEVVTLPWCSIYANDTGSYVVKANYTNVPNSSDFIRGIAFGDSAGLGYTWNVSCFNGTEVDWQATGAVFGVDTNFPTITLDSPDDSSFESTNNGYLTYTPTDASNPEDCVLFTNVSETWVKNNTNTSFTSGTPINENLSIAGAVISDGRYIWNVICNQTSGDTVWAEGTNRTFTIDSTDPTTVNVTLPINNTYSDDSTPTVSWTQTTEINFDKYVINLSNSSDMAFIVDSVEVSSIDENSTTLANIETDGRYFILITTVDLAGNSQAGNQTTEYYLDSDVGTIALSYPADESYLSSNDVEFNFTVTDDNPSNCSLWLSNSTALTSADEVYFNTTVAATAGSVLNITVDDMIDGGYKWNIECADGNNVKYNMSPTLLNVTVDTSSPNRPNLTMSLGLVNSTDGTPTVTWLQSIDNNFQKYVVSVLNLSDAVLIDQTNISTIGTLTTTFTVPFEGSYYFNVTTYDLAGNTNSAYNTTAESTIYVDSVCANLTGGWNLCGLVRESSRNLSSIAAEMDATFISIWNETKQWQTCSYVLGEAGTNCDRLVGVNTTTNNATHVWIYVNESTLWEDRVWEANKLSANISLINVSNNGWNIMSMFVRNGLTFDNLNQSGRLGKNVTMYSLPYNNGTSVPYVTKDAFDHLNKDTQVDYGRAMWVFTNTSTVTFDVGEW